MAMYGIASVLRGRFLAGATMLGYGMGREAIPMLVKDPGFQDWIIKQSGVEPSNKLMIRKLRSGIEATYPLLREMAKSGTGAVALGDKTDSLDAPPVAPGDAPGQVPMDLTPPPQ